MSRNYFNLDEVEIDNILMLNLFPKRRERMNFSDRNKFDEILMPEIIKRGEQLTFMENLNKIHETKSGKKPSKPNMTEEEKRVSLLQYQYDLVFSPSKYFKLAVLITLDSYEE